MAERIVIPQPMPRERVRQERWRWGAAAAGTFLGFWNLFAAGVADFPFPELAIGAAGALLLFVAALVVWLMSRVHWFPPLPMPALLRELHRRHPIIAGLMGSSGPLVFIGARYLQLPRFSGALGILEAGLMALAITLSFAVGAVNILSTQSRARQKANANAVDDSSREDAAVRNEAELGR